MRAVVPRIRNATHGAIGENRLTCETAAGRLAVRRKNSNFASVVVVAPTDGHTVRPGLTLFSRGRIFCFFDGNKFVILLTGFQKKTQKAPPTEIDRAVRLMNEYYEEKRKEMGK